MLNRLVIQHLKDSISGKVIKIHLSRVGRRNDVAALWRELSGRAGLGRQGEIAAIVERVYQWWKTQHVLLILYEVDFLPESFLEEVLRDFWAPLATQSWQGGNPEHPYKLLMFLVDYDGCVGNWSLPFCENPDSSWHPKIPVKLPAISEFTESELAKLIDQDGSMVPFHPLSTRLVETALRGGRLGRAGAYYFHNCPIGHLYHDPMHQAAIPIQDVLDGFRLDRTVVLIFSDAGAARGGFNGDRVELTIAFLQQLKQQAQRVVWLNPMPRVRWTSSTAGKIAQVVPMFEATRQGLDQAINALRGRHQTLTHLREEVK